MRISMIVGIGRNKEIGLKNKLLWHLKEDLQNFKRITMGHHILMGRKTYESIGRPLPGRFSIILSSNKNLSIEGCTVVSSFDAGYNIARSSGDSEFFIIGGEQVYKQFLSKTERLYLTKVDYQGKADAFFPEYEHIEWNMIEKIYHKPHNDNPGWTFQILERK